jgi:adenylate cyclase
MLGDTMNTAARLEDVARDTGDAIIVSEALAALLRLPAGVRLRSLGPVALRGRGELALAAVDIG